MLTQFLKYEKYDSEGSSPVKHGFGYILILLNSPT